MRNSLKMLLDLAIMIMDLFISKQITGVLTHKKACNASKTSIPCLQAVAGHLRKRGRVRIIIAVFNLAS